MQTEASIPRGWPGRADVVGRPAAVGMTCPPLLPLLAAKISPQSSSKPSLPHPMSSSASMSISGSGAGAVPDTLADSVVGAVNLKSEKVLQIYPVSDHAVHGPKHWHTIRQKVHKSITFRLPISFSSLAN